jgi:uncharacterized LabA/DUF88 family protein
MDRVAVLVDAGYFFAAGSALVGGGEKSKRSLITLDVEATIKALKRLALTTTGRELLRIYWYDGASARTGPSAEHIRIAHCNDVKLRLGFLNAVGQQKGVDSLIVTDLVELARNNAISDAMLISGDEDVRIGVVLAQSFGVRVHLVAIHPGRGTQSHQLMQESDTWTEWGLEEVKPLISLRVEVATTPMLASRSSAVPSKSPARSVLTDNEIPAIDDVAAAIVAPLKEKERQGLIQYLHANRNNVPAEFDGKLLARSRTALGRDLIPSEKSYARARLRTLLQS